MVGAAAPGAHSTTPSAADPYRYQTGFGNRFASEALPGVLPWGNNVPQRCKYDLYVEQLNGSSFVSPRAAIRHVWLYRIRPAVAHGVMEAAGHINPYLDSCFLGHCTRPASSPDTPPQPAPPRHPSVVADQRAWDPFPVPAADAAPVDFVEGLRTVGGQGDATLREGLAVHVYAANAPMRRRAFCNNDGDLLVLPQQGRLQIQTELGWLMVRPGELVVLPAGLRFRVLLPDGPSRGYVQEVFGTHFALPELGPLGSNGMALPHDFEHPVAAFDLDPAAASASSTTTFGADGAWEIVYRLAGALFRCRQNHTPFDVVAWRGTLAPYKYATEKFINVATVERDQADPTVYCVLTAPSCRGPPGTPLVDVLVFTPKWLTASATFRPPYYHRNMSTEVMGLLYGTYGGSSHVLEPGGLSYEASYMPHGETYATWRHASTRALAPERICEDTVAFMLHIGAPLLLTHWAEHGAGAASLHLGGAAQWDDLQAHFYEHLDAVDAALVAGGRPPLREGQSDGGERRTATMFV